MRSNPAPEVEFGAAVRNCPSHYRFRFRYVRCVRPRCSGGTNGCTTPVTGMQESVVSKTAVLLEKLTLPLIYLVGMDTVAFRSCGTVFWSRTAARATFALRLGLCLLRAFFMGLATFLKGSAHLSSVDSKSREKYTIAVKEPIA